MKLSMLAFFIPRQILSKKNHSFSTFKSANVQEHAIYAHINESPNGLIITTRITNKGIGLRE